MERTRIERPLIGASTTHSAAADARVNTDLPHTVEILLASQPDDLDRLLTRAPLYNDWDEV